MKYVVWGIGGLLLIGIYYLRDPSDSYLMPKCPFHLLTGYDCPACGVQRAFHYCLHGDWGTAIRYNYFLILSVPYLIAVAVTTFIHNKKVDVVRRYVHHPTTIMIFLALTIIWWIVRNIPCCKEYFNML